MSNLPPNLNVFKIQMARIHRDFKRSEKEQARIEKIRSEARKERLTFQQLVDQGSKVMPLSEFLDNVSSKQSKRI